MALDSTRMRYARCVKGRYWYFRSKVTGDVRLPGQPDEPEFHRAYANLLEARQKGRASGKGRWSLPERDLGSPQEHAARSREVERAWREARQTRKAKIDQSGD